MRRPVAAWRAPGWLRTVAGPNGLTLTGWLLLSVPVVVGTVAMLAGGLGLPVLSTIGWGILAWLALGATWLVARYTWMAGGSTRRREWLILPTYALGGAARAAVGAASTPSASVSVRATIAVSLLHTTLLSVLVAYVVDRLRRLDAVAGQLDATRIGLLNARSRALREAAQMRAASREAILAAVREILPPGTDAPRAAQALQEVSHRVVRPLSHGLATAPMPAADIAAAEIALVRPRRDLPSVARAALDAHPVRPLLTAALFCIFSLPVNVFVHGWGGAGRIFSLQAACIAALLGLATLIPWPRLPTWRGTALLTTVLLATGAASIAVLRVGLAPEGSLKGGATLAALFLCVVGGSIALLQGMAHRQAEIDEWLIAANLELSEAVRAEQAALRRERKHLARVLHGVVQPRLVARALQLQSSEQSVDLHALESEIVALMSEDGPAIDTVDVVHAVGDMAEVWADTVEVTVVAEPDFSELLASYPPCALAITEVACEAVNNAVLRGGARRVEVVLHTEGGVVLLDVINDVGPARGPGGTPGMGTAIYEELADRWDLRASSSGTSFRAIFALTPSPGSPLTQESTLGGAVIADKKGQEGFGLL